jgi:hypothetical protein
MRYKTLVTEKLEYVQNGLKQMKFQAERGDIGDLRIIEEQIQEKIEEILTLLNVNDEQY